METEDLVHNIDVLAHLSDLIEKNFIILPCDLVSNLDLDDILHRHLLWDSLITTVFKPMQSKDNKEECG